MLAGAAAHREPPRPYLHESAARGTARDHAAIERDRAFINEHRGQFHSRSVRDFSPHELGLWRRGTWRHEWHYGRGGWWWDVDGVWYGYPAPIYPYPLEVAPLDVYDTVMVDGPDTGLYAVTGQLDAPGATTTVAVDIPPLPAPPSGWYRCVNPNGYFPFQGGCVTVWALVQEPPPDPQ